MTLKKTRSGDPEDDHFQTPPDLYARLNAEFQFDFDPCPLHAGFDGLTCEWGQSNFINPPYNSRDKPRFIQKAYDEWKQGKTCVLLIPAATSTKQFHELIYPYAEIRFMRGRIRFYKNGVPTPYGGKHDSMVVVFRGSEYAGRN